MARKPEVYLTDTIETWRQKTNRLSSNVGEPDDLNTTNKTNLVSAINELAAVTNSSFIRDQLSVVTSGGGAHSSLTYDANTGRFSFVVNTLTPNDIPELDASKVPTGVFNAAQIPNLDASKITTGIIDLDRLPQSVREAAGGTAGINTTDDLNEGVANLYFTVERARASIVAGTNITYDANTGVISSTGGGGTVDVRVDPDYDIPTDTENSWAAYSRQSVYFFLDDNKSAGENSNYFGIYNNVDPYNDTVSRDNAIFRVDEDGSVRITNTLNVSTSGIRFPDDAFGGSGDTARIYLAEASGGSGEATQLTLEMTNDIDDEIHLKVPSANGVKINGHTAYHAGNLSASALAPNVPIVREAFIQTIQNSGVYYFNSSQYPSNVSRPPDEHEIILVCKIPEHGYVTEDEVYFSQQSDPNGSEEGIVVTRHNNSLLLQLRIGANGPGLVTNKNSGSGHVLTAANWSAKVRFIWWGSDGNYTKGVTDWLSNPAGTGTVTTQGDLSGNPNIEIPGSSSFGTVAVSGQSNLVAVTAGDNLNFAAGTGVTITTDGVDTVTISAGGGGGTTVGGIGTYGWFTYAAVDINVLPGDVIPGSSLRYSGGSILSQQGSVNYASFNGAYSSTAPSGTWQCMGYAPSVNLGEGDKTRPATLFVRIS